MTWSIYYLISWVSQLPDGVEAVKSIAMSKMSKNSGLNEKIEFLQRAEERYYQNEISDKQVNKMLILEVLSAAVILYVH